MTFFIRRDLFSELKLCNVSPILIVVVIDDEARGATSDDVCLLGMFALRPQS